MTAIEAVNIASALAEAARARPYAAAVVCPAGRDRANRPRYTQWTFRQLDRESDLLARGLTRVGIGRGIRTVLMVKPSLEFFALTFALFKAGAVPVFIDPGMGLGNVGKCLDDASPGAFIGIPRASPTPVAANIESPAPCSSSASNAGGTSSTGWSESASISSAGVDPRDTSTLRAPAARSPCAAAISSGTASPVA